MASNELSAAPSYWVDGGGGNAESAAGCCVCGGGGNGEEDDEDAGCGSGDAPGAAVTLAAVRLLAVAALATGLRCIGLWTGFDGDDDCITTRTGLGTRVGGGLCQNEWSGCGPTVTCTVCGIKPFRLIVTGCSCDGTVSAQGVMQVWPWIVRTSAPGGSDSKFSAWS
jgi:hypothetical protein